MLTDVRRATTHSHGMGKPEGLPVHGLRLHGQPAHAAAERIEVASRDFDGARNVRTRSPTVRAWFRIVKPDREEGLGSGRGLRRFECLVRHDEPTR